jgi:hypothetical protein
LSFGKPPNIEPIELTLQNIRVFSLRRGSEEKDIKTRFLAEEDPKHQRSQFVDVKKKSKFDS